MQIIILVDKQGETQTVVKGAKGTSCVQATEFLHSALGAVTQDIPTEDYYLNNSNQQNYTYTPNQQQVQEYDRIKM
jgi:hypothetical protein